MIIPESKAMVVSDEVANWTRSPGRDPFPDWCGRGARSDTSHGVVSGLDVVLDGEALRVGASRRVSREGVRNDVLDSPDMSNVEGVLESLLLWSNVVNEFQGTVPEDGHQRLVIDHNREIPDKVSALGERIDYSQGLAYRASALWVNREPMPSLPAA